MEIREGETLRVPSPSQAASTNLAAFLEWLARVHDVHFPGYDALWEWSVNEDRRFWSAMLEYSDVILRSPPQEVRSDDPPPLTRWFPGATLNYAEHALRGGGDRVAVLAFSERGHRAVTYEELREMVGRVAGALSAMGVGRGDCVAALLPAGVEVAVAFLASASIGAVWTACSPDFGQTAVMQRFRHCRPKVLIAVGEYQYRGVVHECLTKARAIGAALGSVEHLVLVGSDPTEVDEGEFHWDRLLTGDGRSGFEPVPFDHPLWVVYTSGTTGSPKALVHGHGGIVLELNKLLRLHLDLRAEDRFFWYTTTGWVMWNILVSGLLLQATVVFYDGDPAYPNLERLWDLAAEARVSCFGTSAGFVHTSMREGVEPRAGRSLDTVRTVAVTGSPLSVDGFRWVYEHVGAEVFLGSISGGTDVCTAFVGCVPTLPVTAGEIQRRCLAVDAQCFDEDGTPRIGMVGELVVRNAMPSMPLFLAGDDDGTRYRESYFERFPGVWSHGDWAHFTERGTCVVHGRSDATLNRGGVRMGSAEFYSVLDSMPEVADSLVVDVRTGADPDGRLLLLVAPAAGAIGEPELGERVVAMLRSQLSPRHAPDEVLIVRKLPHTFNGKRIEVPVKRLFAGETAATLLDTTAVDDPAAWEELTVLASAWHGGRLASRVGTAGAARGGRST